MNESRTSATELYIAIRSMYIHSVTSLPMVFNDLNNPLDFTEVAIPISQDARNSMEERVAIVKDFADKVISIRT